LVNRLELTTPGKNLVLVCEVLTKASMLGKKVKRVGSSPLTGEDLEIMRMKLMPFLGNRRFLIRVTCLDGLFFQKDVKSLEQKASESVRGKKLGTGLVFLTEDLLRAVCLSMYLPVAGLFVSAYQSLVKKLSNHRSVFDYLSLAFEAA